MNRSTWASIFMALLCAGIQQAQAGVSAPVISGRYYEQSGQNCTSAIPVSSSGGGGGTYTTACQILFSAPPSGNQIALSNVSCTLGIENGTPLKSVYLAQNINGAITRKHPLKALLQGTYEDTSFYTVNEEVGGYLVTAPVRIVMDTPTYAYLTMECQILGTLQSTSAP